MKMIVNPFKIVQNKKKIWETKVLPKLADTILADCNTYVRRQDGHLAESGTPENGGKQIVWNTRYAKKVYYTGTPRRNKNPNASLRWCEVAKRRHKGEWVARANSLLKG